MCCSLHSPRSHAAALLAVTVCLVTALTSGGLAGLAPLPPALLQQAAQRSVFSVTYSVRSEVEGLVVHPDSGVNDLALYSTV